MIWVIFNLVGLGIYLAAALLAGLVGALVVKLNPGWVDSWFESYGMLPFMVVFGVFTIVLDLLYRMTLGKRSQVFEGLENTNGSLLHPRAGGHFFYIPVWILGGAFIAWSFFVAFGSKPNVSARQSNPYAHAPVSQKSSYASTYSYSPEQSSRSLKLAMISGVGSNRIATINGQPFAQGESHALTIDSTKRVVQCSEIRDQSSSSHSPAIYSTQVENG